MLLGVKQLVELILQSGAIKPFKKRVQRDDIVKRGAGKSQTLEKHVENVMKT